MTMQRLKTVFAMAAAAPAIPVRLSRAARRVAVSVGNVFGRDNPIGDERRRSERFRHGPAKGRSGRMRLDMITTRCNGSDS